MTYCYLAQKNSFNDQIHTLEKEKSQLEEQLSGQKDDNTEIEDLKNKLFEMHAGHEDLLKKTQEHDNVEINELKGNTYLIIFCITFFASGIFWFWSEILSMKKPIDSKT